MPRPAILLSEAAKRLLLELRTGGPASRSRIAARLDIGHATVTRLSRELITLGLIAEQEEPATRTGRGRPMVPLVLSGEGGYAVGATVHPGWTEIVALDCAGHLLAREEVPFDDPDPRAFARLLDAQLRAIAGRPGILPYRFLGLGIASTGYVVDALRDPQAVRGRMVAGGISMIQTDEPEALLRYVGRNGSQPL